MNFSYIFDTGLKVELSQSEVNEIEADFNKKKDAHAKRWKKEMGDEFTWDATSVGIPYKKAMEEFCNHKPF